MSRSDPGPFPNKSRKVFHTGICFLDVDHLTLKCALLLIRFKGTETYQLSLFFIPEVKPGSLEAFAESHRNYILKCRGFSVALLQVVIGNAGPDMMDMMQAILPVIHFSIAGNL